MDAFIERLIADERGRFSADDYRGLPGAAPFTLVEGREPVIVSAPHAVTHLRGGRVKASEDFTGPIALALARATGAHAIVATRYDGVDPNFDPYEESAYKQALVGCVGRQGVRLVIDVHGMMSASPALIALGTGEGANVEAWPEIAEAAAGIMEERLSSFAEKLGKAIAVDGRYAARGPNTVCSTVARQCGVAALQVELSTWLRFPGGPRGHKPAGERSPFPADALASELSARANPDPAAVEAAVGAIADIIRLAASGARE